MLKRRTVWAVLLASGLAQAQQDAAAKIRAVVDAASPAANGCYEAALKQDPALEGRLVVALTLGPAGEVKDSSIKEDMLGSTSVSTCVLREIKTLRFPKETAGINVAFPLMFASRARALAVLPFENLTGDPAQDWMRAGMAESLMVKLGQVKSLVLVDRLRLQEVLKEQALVQSGALDTKNAARAGELAGAQLLVLGSVQKAGDAVRINARVVDASSGQVRETVEATGKFNDIFTLQDQLAERLAGAMNVSMDPEARKAMQARVASSQKEMELLGRAATALADGKFSEAQALYRQLVEMNPKLPDAHLGVARSMMMDPNVDRAAKMPEARKMMEDALKLRPDDHEALTYMGFIAFHQQKQDEAIEMQRKALKLKPTHPMGYYGLGMSCTAQQGKDKEALDMLEHAVSLEPDNTEFRMSYAQALSVLKEDNKAALEHSALAMKQDDGPWLSMVRAGIQLRAQDPKGCLATLEAARAKHGKEKWPRVDAPARLVEAACLVKDGRKADVQKTLAKAFTKEELAKLKKRQMPKEISSNAMARADFEYFMKVVGM